MHLTEDELVLHYYGELEPAARRACRRTSRASARRATRSFTTLQRVLAAVEAAPAARCRRRVRAQGVGAAAAGTRLRRNGWMAVLVRALAGAARLGCRRSSFSSAAAFFAGRCRSAAPVRQTVENADARAGLRERILLADLGEHLDRSQTMLVELVSADGDAAD